MLYSKSPKKDINIDVKSSNFIIKIIKQQLREDKVYEDHITIYEG